jgi:hypothetical protein
VVLGFWVWFLRIGISELTRFIGFYSVRVNPGKTRGKSGLFNAFIGLVSLRHAYAITSDYTQARKQFYTVYLGSFILIGH